MLCTFLFPYTEGGKHHWLLNPNPNTLIWIMPKISMENSITCFGELVTSRRSLAPQQGSGSSDSHPSQLQGKAGFKGVPQIQPSPCHALYSELQGKVTFLFWLLCHSELLGLVWLGRGCEMTMKMMGVAIFFQLTSTFIKIKQNPLLWVLTKAWKRSFAEMLLLCIAFIGRKYWHSYFLLSL